MAPKSNVFKPSASEQKEDIKRILTAFKDGQEPEDGQEVDVPDSKDKALVRRYAWSESKAAWLFVKRMTAAEAAADEESEEEEEQEAPAKGKAKGKKKASSEDEEEPAKGKAKGKKASSEDEEEPAAPAKKPAGKKDNKKKEESESEGESEDSGDNQQKARKPRTKKNLNDVLALVQSEKQSERDKGVKLLQSLIEKNGPECGAKKAKGTRGPSAYNLFVSKKMGELMEKDKSLVSKQAMAMAVEMYRDEKGKK